MRLGIVGGRLQGIEAAYLARKAGIEVLLIDRIADVPATGLADEAHVVDVTEPSAAVKRLLCRCDVVLPTCENAEAHGSLVRLCAELDVPLAFDPDAYAVSVSKSASRMLFAELGVPHPDPWPACGYPVIVKPDEESGSHGVVLARDDTDLVAALDGLRRCGRRPIVEQFVSGGSLSVEVLGFGGRAFAYQVTELEFDAAYDCKRVVAPATLDVEVQADLRYWACRLAQGLRLRGVMDVEAMAEGSSGAVIEIDARLPSQTPSAVYHSTDVNLVEQIARAALGREPQTWEPADAQRGVVYQHVAVEGSIGAVVGESRVAAARPLRLVPGFFGFDEALTDYSPESHSWVATAITTAPDVEVARRDAAGCLERLAAGCGLRELRDTGPVDPGVVAAGGSRLVPERATVAS